jgi:hypothetical protein
MRTLFTCSALVMLYASACSSDESVQTPSPITTTDSGIGTQTTKRECDFTADCPSPPAAYAACAEKKCDSGKCVFLTLDADGDGKRSNKPCTATTRGDAGLNGDAAPPPPATEAITVLAGDDCDDNNVNLYPGHSATCSELESGAPVTFPGGSPKGICKAGTKSCLADGKVSKCGGLVAPKTEDCNTTAADEDCDGSNVNGCACTANQQVACGFTRGACRAGTQTCANGAYGACVGSVAPAAENCSPTGGDLDCDGINGNAAVCSFPFACNIQFDWIRGEGCNGSKPLAFSAGNIPIYQCSNGATPATIYLAQACPFFFGGFAGYVSPTSGGTGWVPLAGGYTLQ